MSPRLKKSLSLGLVVLLVSLDVDATQIVENAEITHQQVNISANEQNRIAVEGRRIANVVPSRKGVISVVKDEVLGALYFTFADDSPNPGTLTLFVSDDKGLTYKLILVPRPIAGEEIILRPPVSKASLISSQSNSTKGRAISYQRRIKDLMIVMSDELDDGAEVVPINKEVPLWEEGHLVLLKKYLKGNLVGEKYTLTNTSPSDMFLVEQELYRRDVRAIAIEHQALTAGDTTAILIVRGRKDDE